MFERTLVILKPDALEKDLANQLLGEIRALNLMDARISVKRLTPEQVRTHYPDHADKPYFPRILAFMTRGPCAVVVVYGEDAVRKMRDLAGATDPRAAAPGTIRARFGTVTAEDGMENVIHCSDSAASADREIANLLD